MGISRRAYYKQCRSEARLRSQAATVTALARDVRLRRPRLGKRKLHHLLGPALVELGIKLGRDALFAVLRAVRPPVVLHGAYHKAIQSHHHL